VTVRPVGADVQGDGPLAKLARGEAKLKAGDLPGTIAEIGSLDGRAGQAAAPWLAQAKARLAEDQASVALDAASTELMAPPANSTAQ
jgi:uroporphyrinogen-III synthase